MNMKTIRNLFVILLFSFSITSFSQTLNDAGVSFNEGIQLTNSGDFDGAIESFKNCVDVCDQLGAEGDELKAKAVKQLGKQYFNAGIQNYKDKEYNGAINNFKNASAYAEQAGDTETKNKADNYLAVFYSSFGMSSWKKEDFDKAMDYLNKAVAADPTYSKSYLVMALVYKSKDNPAEMKKYVDKCIEIGGAGDKYAKQAKSVAIKYYLAQGVQKLQASDYSTAIELLNNSMEYGDPDANTYYYLTLAYNGTSNWDKAIETGEKAVAMEQGDKANMYFELAKAYENKGNAAKACETYKMVTSGPNAEAAKYKIEQELTCS